MIKIKHIISFEQTGTRHFSGPPHLDGLCGSDEYGEEEEGRMFSWESSHVRCEAHSSQYNKQVYGANIYPVIYISSWYDVRHENHRSISVVECSQ
jgi:hypothetical protein